MGAKGMLESDVRKTGDLDYSADEVKAASYEDIDASNVVFVCLSDELNCMFNGRQNVNLVVLESRS
jgi:hypothetical protein